MKDFTLVRPAVCGTAGDDTGGAAAASDVVDAFNYNYYSDGNQFQLCKYL